MSPTEKGIAFGLAAGLLIILLVITALLASISGSLDEIANWPSTLGGNQGGQVG